MRRCVFWVGLLMMAACAKPPVATLTSQAPDCEPWQASVTVWCWWPGPGRPARHCEATHSNPPGCGLEEDAVASMEGSRRERFSPVDHPNGTWFGVEVKKDEAGRVGPYSESAQDGRRTIEESPEEPK